MSKHTDDQIEVAMKHGEPPVTAPDPNRDGLILEIDGPSGDLPSVPKWRKLPAKVDEDGLAEIERAVTLKLATLCMLGRITPELFGKALTGIAREWNKTEMLRLNRADKDD